MAEKEHGSEPFTLPAFHILSHSVMAKGRNGNPIQKIHIEFLPCASAKCYGRWRAQSRYNACMSFKAGQHLILGPFSISPYHWARKTIPHKAVLSVLAVHRNDLENFKKNRSLNPIPRDSNLVWGIMIFKAPQVNLMGSHLQSTPMLTKVVSLNYAIYSIHKYLLGRHIGGMGKIYSV